MNHAAAEVESNEKPDAPGAASSPPMQDRESQGRVATTAIGQNPRNRVREQWVTKASQSETTSHETTES